MMQVGILVQRVREVRRGEEGEDAVEDVGGVEVG